MTARAGGKPKVHICANPSDEQKYFFHTTRIFTFGVELASTSPTVDTYYVPFALTYNAGLLFPYSPH